MRTDILKQLNISTPQTLGRRAQHAQGDEGRVPELVPALRPLEHNPPTQPGGNLLPAPSAQPTASRPAGTTSTAYVGRAAGKFVYTGAMDEYKQMLTVPQQAGQREAARPGELHPDRRPGRAEVANGKSFVISTNAQELVNTYRQGPGRHPGRHDGQDPGAGRPGRRR